MVSLLTFYKNIEKTQIIYFGGLIFYKPISSICLEIIRKNCLHKLTKGQYCAVHKAFVDFMSFALEKSTYLCSIT